MKIYIAGKITGEPLEACKAKFAEAESKLREKGAIPINPFKLGIPDAAPLKDAIPHCLKALRQCNAIMVLQDWRQSPVALVEHNHAVKWKMAVYYEEIDGYETIGDEIRTRQLSPR